MGAHAGKLIAAGRRNSDGAAIEVRQERADFRVYRGRRLVASHRRKLDALRAIDAACGTSHAATIGAEYRTGHVASAHGKIRDNCVYRPVPMKEWDAVRTAPSVRRT